MFLLLLLLFCQKIDLRDMWERKRLMLGMEGEEGQGIYKQISISILL